MNSIQWVKRLIFVKVPNPRPPKHPLGLQGNPRCEHEQYADERYDRRVEEVFVPAELKGTRPNVNDHH